MVLSQGQKNLIMLLLQPPVRGQVPKLQVVLAPLLVALL